MGGDGGVKESGVGALIKRIERRKLFGGCLGCGRRSRSRKSESVDVTRLAGV